MTPRLHYVKRYRMELDILRPLPEVPGSDGFDWLGWDDRRTDAHAEAKYLSFRGEPDSLLFPCLGHPAGCRDLMWAIRARRGFVPRATWLAVGPDGVAGTVQGLRDDDGLGAVQNLGVVPGHRGQGLGAGLLVRALHGFRAVGVRRVHLEVTASNGPAVRLYRGFGFRACRTLYKALPVPEPEPIGLGI